jgi:nitroimidazol reductase NimA-like FMN-containing flavoprotein (pyridoxamine 5'-phosphate oxidase superfamily)
VANWGAFAAGDPDLAVLAAARIDRDGLVLVGTLRANGWPRISPVEPLVVGPELYLGMMWRSRKALDLLRDPRLVVHSATKDASGAEGDVKIYGRAVEVTGADEREEYCRRLEERIDWRPEGDFHLFAVDITEVGYFAVAGGGHEVHTWKARGA